MSMPMNSVIPEGHISAPTITAWLAVGTYLAGRTWHRRDWLRNHALVGEALAMHTNTRRMRTRPGLTWDTLTSDAGMSRSTMADRLRWYREHGLLTVITTGSTPATRKGNAWGRHDDARGNLAAEYALIVPIAALKELYGPHWDQVLGLYDLPVEADEEVPWPVETIPERPVSAQVGAVGDETRTPTSVVEVGDDSPTSTGDESPTSTTTTGVRVSSPTAPWPRHRTVTGRRDRVAAAQQLRVDDMTLRHVPGRELARLLRPLFDAGATLADAHHAVNVHPVHGQWTHPTVVLGTGRWRDRRQAKRLQALLRARVDAWFGSDGQLVATLPSQVATAGSLPSERREGTP
ncbi:hypothetical protein DQ384_39585 [Sphaerisporangium album]|uniref:Uncharacterized protein n=1 Tax=Sphaerisporangium album TaxID=509200 RepID=A0A367EKT0_9ACTN|nr:hypothetical protein [Sphaerisporangium album]RCG17800.1 hypothetical protein DQ384_39585 [Sphaerisporangium album]